MKIKKYSLSNLYEMSSGISTTKQQAGHGSPFASFSTVFNNYFLPDRLPDLMETTEKEQESYSIKEGDILITRTSETIDELAMSSVAIKDYPQATYSGFTKRLRPITVGIAYHKYLAFYMRSYLFRKAVTNNAFMTLRASFNEDIFSFLNVYLPEYNQQVKIGDLLFLLEKKINNNKRINAELEAIAKTIYDYWFMQFDFPDENGNPYRSSGGEMVWNKQFKRKIPKGWKVIKVDSICKIISGYPFESSNYSDDGKYKLITIKNVQDDGINLNVDNYIVDLPENLPSYCILKKEDILMSLTGNVGRVGLMFDSGCLLNQRVAIIEPNENQIKGFTYFLFKSNLMRTKIESIATGTSQKNLSPIDATNIIIPCSKSAVNSYCKIANSIISSVVRNSKENQELIKFRDWLLPMLINGQVTVEEDVREV